MGDDTSIRDFVQCKKAQLHITEHTETSEEQQE